MTIERGFVTSASVDLRAAINAAGEMGLDFVELMMHGSGHRRELEPAIAEVRDALDANGLSCLVHLPFSGIDLGSPHEHVQDGAVKELQESVRVAGALGARKGVIHPRSRARDETERPGLMAEGLQSVGSVAAEWDLELCAENMFGGYATVHDTDDIIDLTDASLTYDTGHGRIEGLEGAEAASYLERYRDHVSHVHLNDIRGYSDEHLPFGAGEVDFATVLEPLLDGSRDVTLSLEVGTTSFEHLAHSATQLDALLAG